METKNLIQGIILAAGGGTRLYPLTEKTPKPLLSVGGKPMILYVVDMLVNAGIRDVILVVRQKDISLYENLFGDGSKFGLTNVGITFQPESVKGLPGAIASAQNLIKTKKIIVTCGDVLLEESISNAVKNFMDQKDGARIVGIKTSDTAGYSPIKTKGDKVLAFKPKDKNRHEPGVIDSGTYLFPVNVFEKISSLKLTERGETEIWDLNQIYADSESLYLSSIGGWWSDVGSSIETYEEVNKRYANK